MYEVEVKVEAAHGPVRERLSALGAEPRGEVHQRDTYYDHPVRSFAESDEALRLRRETAGTSGEPAADPEAADSSSANSSLAYKGPLVDDASKTREEVETGVDDPEAADALLRAVGFEPAAVVEKDRERYALSGYVVALDSVRGLGDFVEVEAHTESGAASEEDEVEALRDGAFDLCRRLGLEPADSTRTSYLALLLEDGH